jgi:hypothetical protein
LEGISSELRQKNEFAEARAVETKAAHTCQGKSRLVKPGQDMFFILIAKL